MLKYNKGYRGQEGAGLEQGLPGDSVEKGLPEGGAGVEQGATAVVLERSGGGAGGTVHGPSAPATPRDDPLRLAVPISSTPLSV